MKRSQRFPDFLCIGAPKCGSSWLHKFLESHPHVFIPSALKELHFFDQKFEKGLDWYGHFFDSILPSHKIAGEITPHYLYSDPQRIKQCGSIKKLVVIYRDPVERCISHYKFRMRLDNYNGSFDEFLRDYPESIEWSLYGKYLNRYLECFDRSQFLILRFEESTKDIQSTKRKLASFLQLDVTQFPESAGQTRVNPAFKPRNRFLYKMAIRGAKWLGDAGLYRFRNWLKQNSLAQRFLSNDSGSFDVQISTSSREALQERFAADLQLFQSLVDSDKPRLSN